MKTSTLITLIYFCVNVSFLLLLALYILKTGEHYKAKSLGKDIWAQRKIYAPMLVHFYDTATDLGVVYYWYTLMIDEQNGIDYESIDAEIFFWCGVTFLLFYRVVLFVFLIAAMMHINIGNAGDLSGVVHWYDPLLVVVELYVFRTVYLSYIENEAKIKANIERRKNAKKQFDAQIHVHTLEGGGPSPVGVSKGPLSTDAVTPSEIALSEIISSSENAKNQIGAQSIPVDALEDQEPPHPGGSLSIDAASPADKVTPLDAPTKGPSDLPFDALSDTSSDGISPSEPTSSSEVTLLFRTL